MENMSKFSPLILLRSLLLLLLLTGFAGMAPSVSGLVLFESQRIALLQRKLISYGLLKNVMSILHVFPMGKEKTSILFASRKVEVPKLQKLVSPHIPSSMRASGGSFNLPNLE